MTPDLPAGISAGLFALAIFLSPALGLRRAGGMGTIVPTARSAARD